MDLIITTLGAHSPNADDRLVVVAVEAKRSPELKGRLVLQRKLLVSATSSPHRTLLVHAG
jgi:hypothetical protein